MVSPVSDFGTFPPSPKYESLGHPPILHHHLGHITVMIVWVLLETKNKSRATSCLSKPAEKQLIVLGGGLVYLHLQVVDSSMLESFGGLSGGYISDYAATSLDHHIMPIVHDIGLKGWHLPKLLQL